MVELTLLHLKIQVILTKLFKYLLYIVDVVIEVGGVNVVGTTKVEDGEDVSPM